MPVCFKRGPLPLGAGQGGAQIDQLKLHRPHAAKFVDLGGERRVHPAAQGNAKLLGGGGEENSLQSAALGLQAQL